MPHRQPRMTLEMWRVVSNENLNGSAHWQTATCEHLMNITQPPGGRAQNIGLSPSLLIADKDLPLNGDNEFAAVPLCTTSARLGIS
jgi:hypothetical protein